MPRNEYICDCNSINEEIVENTKKAMLNDIQFCDLADFYKIMGDFTRCKIIFALQQNEMCVCDLANVLSMTKSSVSHQLAKMRTSGVVKCRKDGKSVYYSLDDGHVKEIFETTLIHIMHKKGDHNEK